MGVNVCLSPQTTGEHKPKWQGAVIKYVRCHKSTWMALDLMVDQMENKTGTEKNQVTTIKHRI